MTRVDSLDGYDNWKLASPPEYVSEEASDDRCDVCHEEPGTAHIWPAGEPFAMLVCGGCALDSKLPVSR